MFPIIQSDVHVKRLRHSGLILDCWYPVQPTSLLKRPTPCPVIIFEHGYQGNTRQNSYQMRFLTSQGYVLLAIHHPDESLFTVGKHFSNGEPGRSLNALNITQIPSRREKTRRYYVRFQQSQNRDEILESMKDFSTLDYLTPAHNAVSNRMEKIFSLLVSMRELNRRKELGGLMDLKNVGIYGYSMGGNVSCLLAAKDNLPVKIRAAANLDGVQLIRAGEPLPQIGVPFMMIYGTGMLMGNLMMNLAGANDWLFGAQDVWRVVFPGARHANFSNLGRLAFLRGIVNGRLDGGRMAQALNVLLLSWFDWHLKGQFVDVNELKRLYPWEISFSSFP